MNTTDLIEKIDINVIDVCNRTCLFCPRSVGYPNIDGKLKNHASTTINRRLKQINYNKTIIFSGMGEPLLHKDLEKHIQKIIKGLSLKEVIVITNGDYLTPERAKSLKDAGVTGLRISMYDEDLTSYFSKFLDGFDIVYKHMYKKYDGLVNRVEIYESPQDLSVQQPCYYPFYHLVINYDGKVYLCVNDWNYTISYGSIIEKSIEQVWNSPIAQQYRNDLIQGKRSCYPCKGCSINGMKFGKESFDKYVQSYST